MANISRKIVLSLPRRSDGAEHCRHTARRENVSSARTQSPQWGGIVLSAVMPPAAERRLGVEERLLFGAVFSTASDIYGLARLTPPPNVRTRDPQKRALYLAQTGDPLDLSGYSKPKIIRYAMDRRVLNQAFLNTEFWLFWDECKWHYSMRFFSQILSFGGWISLSSSLGRLR